MAYRTSMHTAVQPYSSGDHPPCDSGLSTSAMSATNLPAVCNARDLDRGRARSFLDADAIWAKMSTTDEQEFKRLGSLVAARSPRRSTARFPVLTAMGRCILHTGLLGTASVLKVITNTAYAHSSGRESLPPDVEVEVRAGERVECPDMFLPTEPPHETGP